MPLDYEFDFVRYRVNKKEIYIRTPHHNNALVAMYQIVTCLIVTLLSGSATAAPPRPHIVFVFGDDLGWNDVGYQGTESAVLTPHIDALAASGVKLNNYYVQPICSPSRVAFLTGRYPSSIGVLATFGETEISCMPFVGLLPETLASLGYTNHLIGKWHLGFCKQECLPTSRGFHTFSGFYNGGQDYYTHEFANGFDWRVDNSSGSFVMWDYAGQYGLDLMDNAVTEVISAHDSDTPMFLYYAMQAVHSPLQPRPDDEALFSSVTDDKRRQYLGLGKGMDDSMDVLVTALQDAGMYDDTILVFSSDNGGNSDQGGNNWPLSGGKGTYFEGGVKANAFASGHGISQTNVLSTGLMHAVDWFPTLVAAASGNVTSLGSIDGVDQWGMISAGGASARSQIVHNVKEHSGVVRKGDMKLIKAQITAHERVAPPESSDVTESGLSTAYEQLYNITADPNETTNLARDRDYSAIKADLDAIITTYRAAASASIHVAADPTVANTDADGAYVTGWC